MIKKIIPGLLFIICIPLQAPAQRPLVDYVSTLQGTNSSWDLSYGNVYPTIALPFPVHSWSPQTGKNGDGWKYTYKATTIRGFQQVHQCSPWMGDYGVFSLMPVAGKLEVNEEARATAFRHENETAKPSYYKVKFDNNVVTEITPTERAAHMRFSFPKGREAYLVLDGYTKFSFVKIIPGERKLIGYVTNGTFIPGNFKNHFVIEFDQPFVNYGTWSDEGRHIQEKALLDSGQKGGAFVQFRPGTRVQVRVSSSYISQEQAALNLKQELGGYAGFDDTKRAADKVWNELLGRVRVEGDSEADKATFYSCVFRANLFSHKFYDIKEDGSPYYFSPYDDKVHDGYMYTDNGFWDTFRAQFPLTNILHPTMQGRYMQSLLDAQEQYGFFPTWSNPGMSGVMIGNHAISLLTDAWVKGIRNFDPGKALDAYYHEATNKGPWGGSSGREGSAYWFSLGYIPYKEVSESGAKSLEYAYDDWCAYQLAKLTGNKFYENVFARQMYNYKNVFDTTVGFVRGRDKNGNWVPKDFDPVEWGDPFTEGNPWQWSWSVFHDINGLIQLMGGADRFNAKLDSLFTAPNTVKYGSYGHEIHEMKEMVLQGLGQYAHGNEPVQHAAYLYNYSGQPWKSQKQLREIMRKIYNATPSGFPGDEDQGETSSWYVLSALGLYAVCPGTDQYVIGSPVFSKATIILENGKQFTIQAKNNSEQNVYIQSAKLNNKTYHKNWIRYADITNGGILELEMGATPNKERGVSKADRPYSVSLGN
ncbi:GH92 family glycosyl hydrolase [Niabella beijingensis]|uniref:GH92 family glycosyl hydrolase n=1 Tax=Niabella beijingensis TaxID=2872700 RepID=UPI001CBD86CE|nr:GH92 family glycosyl hydrolase [Niabella beijingensis]MBZ4191353.1 GH92 family glycosyl hydrolase [Niabella beijingensis]